MNIIIHFQPTNKGILMSGSGFSWCQSISCEPIRSRRACRDF